MAGAASLRPAAASIKSERLSPNSNSVAWDMFPPREYSVMDRKIETLVPGQRIIDDGDMLLYRALPAPDRVSIGLFVFLDHYRHHSSRGIGDKPHPHAGTIHRA